jgi:hypothetical protein
MKQDLQIAAVVVLCAICALGIWVVVWGLSIMAQHG